MSEVPSPPETTHRTRPPPATPPPGNERRTVRRKHKRRTGGRWLALLAALLVLGGIVAGFWPDPVPVELAKATTGPLEVAVTEDGRTRVREKWQVSAPQAGVVSRIELRPGDPVERGEVIATLGSLAAPLLDPRAQQQAAARVEAAQAALKEAQATVARARAASELATREYQRTRRLHAEGAASGQERDRARSEARVRQAELDSARFAASAAAKNLDSARAELQRFQEPEEQTEGLDIIAPVSGRVLSVQRESAGAVETGAPLVEIAQAGDLEVVVDLLTTDAVDVEPGDPATIIRWGGGDELHATVRRVEPSAFTKTSSLGVEEQRVNVLLDPVEDERGWRTLGDQWRVEVRIVTWRGDEVLQVPLGAVFRHDGRWALFTVREGRAERVFVRLGRTGEDFVQVLEGIENGAPVLLHPADAVVPGVRVEQRATGE